MPSKRSLKLEDCGISAKRFKELSGFCEQYPEWKEELRNNISTLKSNKITNMPVGNGISKPTEMLAIRREELREKCELIEQVAGETDLLLVPYLIKSVCYEKPLWYLRDIMGMPCNQTDFYSARKQFYYLLSLKKK